MVVSHHGVVTRTGPTRNVHDIWIVHWQRQHVPGKKEEQVYRVVETPLSDFLETHTTYCIVYHAKHRMRSIIETIVLAHYFVLAKHEHHAYQELAKNCESLILYCKLKYRRMEDVSPAPEVYTVVTNLLAACVLTVCLAKRPRVLGKLCHETLQALPPPSDSPLASSMQRYASSQPNLYVNHCKVHFY